VGDIGLKWSILGRVTGPVMLDKSKKEMDMQDLKDLETVTISC
jgi:hypothetical protein